MIKFPNFKFRLNVSRDNYESKADAIACLSKPGAKILGKEKMAFAVNDVTVSEFLNYALSGHTFCNLFQFDPNQSYWLTTSEGKSYQSHPVYMRGPNRGYMKLGFKSDAFFYGSQAIFVDVDYTRFDNVLDYLNTLTYTPTCVYMSYSDKKPKHDVVSRRFRMVYVMDYVLNKEEFLSVSNAITRQIEVDTAEPMVDDCGTRISQYMNGVWGNAEYYQSDIIYTFSDFPAYQVESTPAPTITTSTSKQRISFDKQLLCDMETMECNEFMHRYYTRYRYVYRTEKTDWPYITYQLTDENYLQTWYYREKQVDGQHRRAKLYKNACLRRLMYPDIDADTLLYNLYLDMVFFFDNSDGVITIDTLKRKVVNAIEKTREELEKYCEYEIRYWRQHRPRFIVNSKYELSRGQLREIDRHLRWKEIEKVYDRTRSVAENVSITGVPLSTLYRYCNDSKIDPNPAYHQTKNQQRADRKMEKQKMKTIFREHYQPSLSLRKNQEYLKIFGVYLSIDTIRQWSLGLQ